MIARRVVSPPVKKKKRKINYGEDTAIRRAGEWREGGRGMERGGKVEQVPKGKK